MSTIAYRDGVMAADSRAYSGYSSPIGAKQKIRSLWGADAGWVLAGVCTSQPGASEAIHEWLYEAGRRQGMKGLKKASPPNIGTDDFTILLVIPTKKAPLVYYANGSFLFTGPLLARYWAIGSGTSIALGAMEVGAHAEAAVKAACIIDPMTAEPIHTLRHK